MRVSPFVHLSARADEELLEEDLEKFMGWLRGLEVAPTIRQLQEMVQGTVEAEWGRVGGRLSHLSQRDRDVVGRVDRGQFRRQRRLVRLARGGLERQGRHRLLRRERW